MLELYKLDKRLVFPAVESALHEPNGLLAFGGDLSEARLLSAYRKGIFPWFGDDEPYLWWSPDPRGLIKLSDFHCSKSLAKSVRKNAFEISINTAFDTVINRCSNIPRNFGACPQTATWITAEMMFAYQQLHLAGYASSVEVWLNNELVGGLYGVCVGGVFCGESMFHSYTDASKIALMALVQHMQKHHLGFIDCQMNTEHLARLGCKSVKRSDFISLLNTHKDQVISREVWASQRVNIDL